MANDTAESPGIRLPWAGKNVRIEHLEEELAFLWKMSADNLRTGQNTNVRTSVLNLVICAPDIETARHASTVLRDLSSTHLARVTILILDRSDDAPASITTWITLRCFSVLSDLMRHCFEQTTMLATGSALRFVANMIQPLLKPDLPVYLWWLGDPPDDDTIFSSLVNLSTRVIVDSTSFFNPEQDILTLASFIQASPQWALSDLNWGRITLWRQLVAQFFDVAEYRPYLAGINSIEIEHVAAPLAMPIRTEQGEVSPNPTRALLLAGWLKALLGWTLPESSAQHHRDTASGTYRWHMERSAGPRATHQLVSPRSKMARSAHTQHTNIHIRPRVQPDMRPGSICLVRLVSQIENKRTTFTINREDDPDNVFTSVEQAKEIRLQRTVNLVETHKESDLLHDELEIMGHDHLFEQTLQEVAELLE